MENRADLKSILPLLPLSFNSSNLSWPSPVIEALKSISKGPDHSRVHSGEVLFLAISDINSSLYDNDFFLDPYASQGYSLFFDKLMENEQSAKWFTEVVPKMAEGLLRLPDLLVTHYKEADGLLGGGVSTGLRILGSQEPGIMFLTQELVGILLTCSFFCLFPSRIRGANLQAINFDKLFAYLYDCYSESLENKVKCIVHYFERIYSCMPTGLVSYERKVLLLDPRPSRLSYPGDDFWRKSAVPLCHFQVCSSGLIEDQSTDSLEVDFANKYLGGGALRRGCVQEEIRFMINPELIAGMLFLPCMAENEAIEIVGTERFSNYTGYAASFRFSGDHIDRKEFDPLKRRKTRIVAIDALCHPGGRQFEPDFILREINKAFCGFFNQMEYEKYLRLLQDRVIPTMEHGLDAEIFIASGTNHLLHVGYSVKQNEGTSTEQLTNSEYEEDIGIVTGNWGCGAFGGDPELKTIIQWLAASQALRPFITYCTFGLQALDNLDQVTQWIFSHKWTVGDLWVMLAEYSSQRLKGETRLGFFVWLLPSISAFDGEDTKMLVIP